MYQAATLSQSQLQWPSAKDSAATVTATEAEHNLARMIAEGDMLAFEELYNKYNRRIYSLCFRMTHNAEEAEDLAQEVFLHVYRKIGSFRGESALMTWLHRLTVNQVLMHFRKNRTRRENTTTDDVTASDLMVGREGALRQVSAVDDIALYRAIARLAPGYRAVFVLHDVEGYEHAEIAHIRGISIGTSKSQLHKARIKLRKLITQKVCRSTTAAHVKVPRARR